MRYWELSCYQIRLLQLNVREYELLYGPMDAAFLTERNEVICRYSGVKPNLTVTHKPCLLRGREQLEAAAVIRTGLVAPDGLSDKLDEVVRGHFKTAS